MIDRRQWLALSGTLLAEQVLGAPAAAPVRLAAAWQTAAGAQVGVLGWGRPGQRMPQMQILHAMDVPSRAHGLVQTPSGALLAVARRPGEWLMRWQPPWGEPSLVLAEPGRVFNGHVLCSPQGETIYTTETDLDTGQGLVGVRDAVSLVKHTEWPTHGMDPHALVWDARVPAGARLCVANGGITQHPETGRIKWHLDRMDSSLVCLDASDGHLHAQWRLPDARLSLRHLAWRGQGAAARLGVALQAEHDAAAMRAVAPVLALLEPQGLRTLHAPIALAGYGGDLLATREGWLVSCPRAHGTAQWRADGHWSGFRPLESACALAAARLSGEWWAAGASHAQRGHDHGRVGEPVAGHIAGRVMQGLALPPSLALENHWVLLHG